MVVPLEATSLPAAGWALVERLSAAGAISNIEKLRARVEEERPEDIVAMGDKAFLLHYRTDAAADLVVAVGTSRQPVCRELGDGERQCARVILLIVAPPKMAARYLQVVGAFARFLDKPERVEAVLAQPEGRALAALPALASFTLREQLSVRDIMSHEPRSVSPETPLRAAARDMVRFGLGGLPVVDENEHVVGMLSEKELMRHLLANYLQGGATQKPLPPVPAAERAVRDVMTRQVLCVSPDQPLAEVASIMTNKDVDRVPVVKEGRLIGFLTRGDIVRKLIGS